MNSDEGPAFVARVFSLYPPFATQDRDVLADMWRENVRDLPYDACVEALNDWAGTHDRAPRPQQFRLLVLDRLNPSRWPTVDQAWAWVVKYLDAVEFGDVLDGEFPMLVHEAIKQSGVRSTVNADRSAFVEVYRKLLEEDDAKRRAAYRPGAPTAERGPR